MSVVRVLIPFSNKPNQFLPIPNDIKKCCTTQVIEGLGRVLFAYRQGLEVLHCDDSKA